ncbi:Homer protein [Quillaja saponaria]|uniref:Homer protein n=1 Tax=Quillaja saponaria TaxID=32244 RepID=A0AAD7KTW8_QUISA|nr:Homer protein [Quillaja saponaria]
MPTITNTTWIPSPYRILSRRKFFLASLPCTRIFQKASLAPKFLAVACSSSEGRDNNGGSDFKDTVSGVVGEQVEELLSKEENRVLLDGLEKASQRVEIAKRELAEIERQELAAKQFRDYINQVEGRASEIAECQREILEAKAMVEEAERSLLVNENVLENGDGFMGRESDKIDKDEERWESIKAASVSAIVGTLAGLPITFTQFGETWITFSSRQGHQQLLPLLKVLQPLMVDRLLN